MPVDFANLLEQAKESIVNTFKDITNIQIVTAVADKVSPPGGPITNMDKLLEVEIDELSYYARTSLQMDGDSKTLLPSGPDPARIKEVTEFHQTSTKRAVQTWNKMAYVAFTGIAIAAEIAEKPLPPNAIKLIERFGFVEPE